MTATVISFRRTTAHAASVTSEERAAAAAWCAEKGRRWHAAHLPGDETSLEITWVPAQGIEICWWIAPRPEGLVLIEREDDVVVGLFGSIEGALAALAKTIDA